LQYLLKTTKIWLYYVLILTIDWSNMKRIIDSYLLAWKQDPHRQPLLLRGARQVGKTFAVRELGKTYPDFVEINLESMRRAHAVFDKDFDPVTMLSDLAVIIKKSIDPSKTLLFIDEIQAKPEALTALRYFYEQMPELHIIAAGSLLDFTIKEVGIPVGRVQSFYMYPLSFIEFLAALAEYQIIDAILTHDVALGISSVVHARALELIGQYLALGGMPGVLQRWQETRDVASCSLVQATIIDSYRQDFGKYARQEQIKYVENIFQAAPQQLGGKFKYSSVDGEYRRRELAPALDLLATAGVLHKVYHSAGQGIPLGSQIDGKDYKTILLDVGISQALLGLDLAEWFVTLEQAFINKGPLMESFVGQELLAYGSSYQKKDLFYWHREAPSSQAEVDYLIQKESHVIPIEVKSGSGRTLKSIQLFLATHEASPYGMRFSTNNYSIHNNIHSYPLYAIITAVVKKDAAVFKACRAL
jgi:predicted AAA+ superfamily ATPase